MADLVLTEDNSGGRYTVHVGNTIHLRFSENASTGYRWTLTEINRELFDVEAENYQAGNGAVGSGDTVTWDLRAKRAGSARLELVKSRQWEGRKDADQHFALELKIIP
jgi:predicted secreted protein